MNASTNQNGIMWLTINANTRGNHYRTESDMETGEVFYIRNDHCEPKIITPEKKPSNKEAELIKEWWGIYTEEEDGKTYWYSKEEHYIPVGGYNRDWLKEDGKTPWSMLQIRRQVCREGNLKRQENWCFDIREMLKCYELNEKYWNDRHVLGWEGNDRYGTRRVFQSRMMRKISDLMSESLKDLKDECRRKGISGFSGKKKWALVNHIIEYDTGFDIYSRGKGTYLPLYTNHTYQQARYLGGNKGKVMYVMKP